MLELTSWSRNSKMPENELFPWESFRYRIDLMDKKDKRTCWFECQEHADKFVKQHKLKKKDYKLTINK